tara:strand:+ start:647 stop:2119 length:1473 start_codon:yes stop_codon:yes gene_type:complete
MTINYSSDNDIIIPTQHNTTYRGLGGDDTYIITQAIGDEAKINIVDTEGTNIIQLTEGLSILSSKFASTAFQIILSNNAEITINSSHKNLYEIGGNVTNGLIVDQNSYEDFIVYFGLNSLPSIKSIKGSTNVIIEGGELITNNKIFSWKIMNPESAGLDTSEVNDLMDFVKSEGSNTQAAILIRGSSIIAEYYADKSDKDSIVTSWSVAKSFTSTLIGIAIDEGYINSIEDPITDYLPEWKGQDQDKILLKHLLSMRSGMEDHGFVYVVNDMVSHSLDRDPIRPPGTAFRYSNEDSMLLGEIVQNATGISFQEYADKKLFNLIDVDETWWTDQEGSTISYASIDMTPREFAKFGLMIAQEGSWQGQQIVSSNWVELATSKYDDLMSYGFQWWTSETKDIDYPFFSAKGLDGQLIYVWPETDLVFVRFTTYNKIGDQDSSVVRINSIGDLEASYQQTETGNLNTIKLEELLYDIGDNLIMASDLISVSDFG